MTPPLIRARTSALAAALATCAWACRTTEAERYRTLTARAEPSLEAIFGIPGIHGEPPRIQSVSADGEWLIVRWRRTVAGEDGRRAWADEEPLRLIEVARPAEATEAEPTLAAALERATGEASPTPSAGARRGGRRSEAVVAWSPSGHTLAAWWNAALWLVEPDEGGDSRAELVYRDPAAAEEPAEPAREPNAAARAARAERLGSIASLAFSDDGNALEVRAAGELWIFPIREHALPLALADAACPTELLEVEVDEVQIDRDRRIAFAPRKPIGTIERAVEPEGSEPERFDAHVLDLSSGARVALEGYRVDGAFESAQLSPDGRFVFAAEPDRAEERAPTLVPDYLTERVTTIEGRRQLADDMPLPRKLWIWSTADGARREIELPGDLGTNVQDFGWAPQPTAASPARLGLRRMSTDFRVLEAWLWTEGTLELALVDRDERWVGGPASHARFSRDGSSLMFGSESFAGSRTPGRSQLFELDLSTQKVVQRTDVEGEVSSFTERDDGTLAVCASRADPRRRALASIAPDAREPGCDWLDVPDGFVSEPRLAREGDRVFFRFERLGEPAEIWSGSLVGREPPRRLTRTIPRDYAEQSWLRPVPLLVRHPDGTAVRAHVFVPRPSSLERPDRRRPCAVFIHGAGYLQNVTDSMTEYAVNLMFHSRLASMGYVVLDVDYRGSAGYGNRFRTDVQFQLGKLELEDIGAAVDELARRGVIDPGRVGCYGGSYGGFLTLMALFTQAERWTCGAALRSVTDWRTYTPGYTQPRLGRPSTHAEAYAASSPIDRVEGLRDPLLVLHGLVDTNVFAQDSVRLVEKLIDLGRDFDAMLYPSQGHGFEDGAHWLDEYRRIERFLVQHLGLP